MKAITIWQPWASLLACGAKMYETRSWATSYRGPIAIHAGKKDCVDMMSSEQINALIRAFTGTRHEVAHDRAGGGYDYLYPCGAIIATAELVECHCMITDTDSGCVCIDTPTYGREMPSAQEYLFGDWTPGRYALEFANMKMLDEPIPTRGGQRIWNWEGVGIDG